MEVGSSDGGSVVVTGGAVRCDAFPVVALTSNGERDFPPAFLRRCVQLDLPQPDDKKLGRIVAAHLGSQARDQAAGLSRSSCGIASGTCSPPTNCSTPCTCSPPGGLKPGFDEVVAAIFRSLGEPG